MNQESNNLNQNNFNIQGNNGIPNNQPLQNNQGFNPTFNQNVVPNTNVNQPVFNPQPTVEPMQQPVQPQQMPSYQQPIIQGTTPQPANSVESGNNSNQNLNSKPPKKTNLGLIIGIVAVVAVVGVGIVFGSKLLSNGGRDISSDNKPNSEQEENINTNENNDIKIVKASSYFDTNKFDKSKYSGYLYGYDGSAYKVTDFINNIGYNYDYNNQVNVIVDYFRYAFSSDYESEKKSWNSSGPKSSDAYIHKIIEVLGQPSSYCEIYYQDDNGTSITGDFLLVYNYDDYLITFPGLDMRNWNEHNYKYPQIIGSWIYKTDDFYSGWNYGTRINEYTCYGEQLKRG